VLVSGSGTNLQALLDACRHPSYGAVVVAVGSDRPGIEGLARAEREGIDTFVHRVADYPTRAQWDAALTRSVAAYEPDLIVSAGFMKLSGEAFLTAFPVGTSTPTPRCCRRSPACTGRATPWRTASG
jgi:phosphoribosylglycinamide formyltransferase-1